MRITNKLNLPEPFVNYVEESERPVQEHRYSVTELLLPVREILLSRRMRDYLESDVADSIPALFGTAVHRVLEEFYWKDRIEEGVSLEEPVCETFRSGKTVLSGRIDVLDMNAKTIIDYKTCSVSKIMKEDFEDWRLQGLMYAYLVFREKGELIKRLKFIAMAKDWSKIKSATSTNYPKSAVYVWEYEIPESDYDFIGKWIESRLDAVEEADENIPECTDEEKWYTGTKWAVYKKEGDARAACVCDSEEEANGYLQNKLNGVGAIQKRLGEYIKCKYYCPCAKFCEKGGKDGEEKPK